VDYAYAIRGAEAHAVFVYKWKKSGTGSAGVMHVRSTRRLQI
jgi:hypothetical protein